MDWDELGLSGVTGGHQYELLGWTGLNWDELGWTGMAIGVLAEHLSCPRWHQEVFGSYWDGLG